MLTASKVFNLSVIDFGEEKCEPNHSAGPGVRSYYLIHYILSDFFINAHRRDINFYIVSSRHRRGAVARGKFRKPEM